MHNTSEVLQQARRIEDLVAKLESSADPALVATARELVEALMDLHGAALERILEMVAGAGAAGDELTSAFGRDDLVGNLLVLYDLHPSDLETRARSALDTLKPRDVELLGVIEGVVTVRAQSTTSGCGSSGKARKAAIEEAIFAAAPDAVQVIILGLPEPASSPGFVPLETLVGTATPAILVGADGGL